MKLARLLFVERFCFSRVCFYLISGRYVSTIGAPLEHYRGNIGVREMNCGHSYKEGKGLRTARATVLSSPRSHPAQTRALPDLNQGRADLQAAALTIEVLVCCLVRCSRPFCSAPGHASPAYPIGFDPTPLYFIPSTHPFIDSATQALNLAVESCWCIRAFYYSGCRRAGTCLYRSIGRARAQSAYGRGLWPPHWELLRTTHDEALAQRNCAEGCSLSLSPSLSIC